jgi:hypothetical protein
MSDDCKDPIRFESCPCEHCPSMRGALLVLEWAALCDVVAAACSKTGVMPRSMRRHTAECALRSRGCADKLYLPDDLLSCRRQRFRLPQIPGASENAGIGGGRLRGLLIVQKDHLALTEPQRLGFEVGINLSVNRPKDRLLE